MLEEIKYTSDLIVGTKIFPIIVSCNREPSMLNLDLDLYLLKNALSITFSNDYEMIAIKKLSMMMNEKNSLKR